MKNTNSQQPSKSLELCSPEALDLLKEALELLDERQGNKDSFSSFQTRMKYESSSSSSENEEQDQEEDSSSSSSSEEEEGISSLLEKETAEPDESSTTADAANDKHSSRPSKTTRPSAKQQGQTKKESSYIVKQSALVPRLSLALKEDNLQLQVPTALVSKHDAQNDTFAACRSLTSLSTNIQQHDRPIVVLLLRSGRFAGGIFIRQDCVVHRACQRYTTRRGQGKAQSSQDASKKAKSMGAQLRRAGEEGLKQDVQATLKEWESYIESAALILISCPPTMKKEYLFGTGSVLEKTDTRLRKVPLDVGRPTFESVKAVYHIMMQVTVVEKTVHQENEEDTAEQELATVPATPTEMRPKEVEDKKEIPITPLTPLHTAAAEGNVVELTQLLQSGADERDSVDIGAGPDHMTPLHYAADSTSTDSFNGIVVDPAVAAEFVSVLLLQGSANPCVVDARNRVPYFLASHEKVRDAFCMARAELGEDAWDWNASKVGPPLNQEKLQQRKQKAAEKKRRQRARQKQRKQQEKLQQQEAERLKQEQELQKQQEQDAKRIRDGLQPKASTTATNVCDYCQKVCKGKKRSQMYSRLDYAYCSSECVAKHKRELMAAAAMSRLGG